MMLLSLDDKYLGYSSFKMPGESHHNVATEILCYSTFDAACGLVFHTCVFTDLLVHVNVYLSLLSWIYIYMYLPEHCSVYKYIDSH